MEKRHDSSPWPEEAQSDREPDDDGGSEMPVPDDARNSPGELPGFHDLLGQDLSRLSQILPEETRLHLKRAGSEAALALYHLWRSVEDATRPPKDPKRRRRIDVD